VAAREEKAKEERAMRENIRTQVDGLLKMRAMVAAEAILLWL